MRVRGKYLYSSYSIVWHCLLLTGFIFLPAEGKNKSDQISPKKNVSSAAASELRVHNVGNFRVSVTNFGFLGSYSGSLLDPCTHQSAPSAEFPAGTGVNYLFQGALWVGAIVGQGPSAETLVTVGADGWQNVNEMIPGSYFSSGTTRAQGIVQGSCYIPYSPEAVSEQDYLASITDTCTDCSTRDIDPYDGPFVPLGIEFTQKSYAWSYDYAKDFILFEYTLENMGAEPLSQVFVGLYIDADCHNPDVDPYGFQDDVSGFKLTVPSLASPLVFEDTINLAWSADNDGLSNCGICDDRKYGVFIPQYSPTAMAGTRVINSPNPNLKYSFNWWNSQSNSSLDWGPWTQANLAIRPSKFPGGVLGTPEGNRAKYFIMSNGEFDYDQLWSASGIWQDSGWLPPPSYIVDLADGYDTRYLYSFGPFDLQVGDTIPLTLAYVAGENFHVRPSDWNIVNNQLTDPVAVQEYYNKLDFSDLAINARWADWVYDNPGIDTDGDGYRGKYRVVGTDTIYYQGDGVPDFSGPRPPQAPAWLFQIGPGSIKITWNGRKTENAPDNFSGEKDFEGYRIWLSYTGFPNDFSLLDSYDKKDLKMNIYNPGTQKWSLKVASLDSATVVNLFAYDNLCCYADVGGCTCLDTLLCQDPSAFGKNPYQWTKLNPYTYKGACSEELQITSSVSIRIDDKVAFEPQDWNQDLLTIKKYKNEIEQGIYTPADSEFYEYEYLINTLSASAPFYVALTAFDYGNPQTGLPPIETSPQENAQLVACLAIPGDANASGGITIGDIIHLVNYIFDKDKLPCLGADPGNCWTPNPFCRGDANQTGTITIGDIIHLVNYIFDKDRLPCLGSNPGNCWTPEASGACCLSVP